MVNLDPQKALPIVPIRKGSKGLPDKNVTSLAGRALYLYSVEQALRLFGQCVISTDIPSVLNADLPENCYVIERPEALSQDTTPMDDVLLHVLDDLEDRGFAPDICVLLQATSPLRKDDDVRKAVEFFKINSFDLVKSVSPVSSGFLKYGSLDDNGAFIPVVKPEYCFSNRQDLPDMVRPNGAIYVFGADTFKKNGGMACQSIGAIQTEQSIDIDVQADLARAEQLINEQSADIIET
ncbi:MAG: acylneuraminate cytidylyltransferase family protein [Rhizobiaceae bacterium]|nr:acylneuraminate cytidylyltransferase family protein [Rhizobiaceae bacterium]